MDSNDDDTQGETARILVEFLEVAVTSIVFHKGIYPSGAFERRRYMNAVVQRAKHPQLRDYIHSTVNNLLPFIQQELVDRVAVLFFNADNVPLEKYIFKLNINQSSNANAKEDEMESTLRSFLIKLSVSQTLSVAFPHECRWEITAYFRSFPQMSTSNNGDSWIPTNTKQWHEPPLITPIKSMNSNPLCVQLYLEHPSSSEGKL